jgi:hypothetical protein
MEGALRLRVIAALDLVVGDGMFVKLGLVLTGEVIRQSLLQASPAPVAPSAQLLGRVIVQLSRSHGQGAWVFPYLEHGVDGVQVNANKASCDSNCGEGAAAAANEAGVPYCCCSDVLQVSLAQGEALWLGLREQSNLTANPYAYSRSCPLSAPTAGLEMGGAALPTGAWMYLATVSLPQ